MPDDIQQTSDAATEEPAVVPNRAERRNKGKQVNKSNGVQYNPHIKTASTGHQRQYSNRRSGG